MGRPDFLADLLSRTIPETMVWGGLHVKLKNSPHARKKNAAHN